MDLREHPIRALGDPDAVSVGDYHLPHEVGYALTGHCTDDAGMLERSRCGPDTASAWCDSSG